MKLPRGVEKVALAPGERERIRMSVDVRDLAYYDTETRGWAVKRMEYEVMVGPSSRPTDLLTAMFKIVD